jgi:hypothetical protein
MAWHLAAAEPGDDMQEMSEVVVSGVPVRAGVLASDATPIPVVDALEASMDHEAAHGGAVQGTLVPASIGEPTAPTTATAFSMAVPSLSFQGAAAAPSAAPEIPELRNDAPAGWNRQDVVSPP